MGKDQSTAPTPFELRLADDALGDEIQQWLIEHGVEDQARWREHGVLPLLPIVIAGMIGAATFTSLFLWVRARTACQLILDVRGDSLKKQIDCRIRDGRVIVISSDDVRVEIHDVPPAIDLSAVVTAAMSGSADAIVRAAASAGGQVLAVPAD